MKQYRRVKCNEEFQSVMRAKRFQSSLPLVLYTAKRQQDVSRVGISVGKKIGNAVVRNHCKRQIRMMAQEIIAKEDEFDYIILVRKDYLKYSFADNKKQLENLYKKVKIRKNKGEQ